MTLTYMDAIGLGFPLVGCHCIGDANIYNNIVYDSGDAIPSQAALDAIIITETKTIMWQKIKDERNRRRSSGVKVGTIWVDSDDTSRIQQLALVIFGANLPANIMWKTLNNSFVEMTPTFAAQIFQASTASDLAIYTVAETHKAYMLASNDPANYNYLTGWPLAYGE